MTYVIKSAARYTKKTGESAGMISYFKYHSNMVFAFNSMTLHIDEAKKYEFKAEAEREKRKYFSGDKTAKVIKYNQN